MGTGNGDNRAGRREFTVLALRERHRFASMAALNRVGGERGPPPPLFFW